VTTAAALVRPSLPALPGLVVLALGIGVADVIAAASLYSAVTLTVIQSALLAPWATAVLRLRGEGLRPSGGWGLRLFHVAAIALAVLCLASKWVVLVRYQGGTLAAYRTYAVVLTLLAVTGLLGRGQRLGRLLLAIADQPARLMLLSFAFTALLGALVLMLPASLRQLGDARFVDALFMATSAVCVTGLAVHDLSTTYTPFGQVAILAMIQAGGLGIMVLSTFFFVVAGRRLRLRSTAVLAETLDMESLASLKVSVVRLVTVTVACEALGAAALYLAFRPHGDVLPPPEAGWPASGPGGRLWAAVFHAISAFCNAGFSLFPGNMTAFVDDVAVNVIMMALIVLGGLGFPVVDELLRRARQVMARSRPPRLSLHARTVLVVSAGLIAALSLLTAGLEWERSLGHLAWPHKLLASLFHSVNARTSGFNTVDVGSMRAATLLAFGVAMFIGASPGSTGGGIKTTTFAALVATLRAVLLGQRRPRLFDRSLSEPLSQRAVAVTVLSGAIVATLGFVLLVVEREAPERLLFEAMSAFATVGLSTGVTADLSPTGKLVVSFTMLAGRIGPLTLALALAGRARRPRAALEPAEERVLIG
jgi:trk system potassium uptake protein TrkH